jgi:hypothetical protein
MTKFVKANFVNSGGYVTYDNQFVARFKYAKGSAGSFITFLIKNFTVEEYFKALETSPPLTVLQAKGYLQPHIKKWLKEAGLPVTPEGFKQLVARDVEKTRARLGLN